VLCFLLHDVITNWWVESSLRIKAWYTWLELMGKINPAAISASKAVGAWLSSKVAGSISNKETLLLETSVRALAQVEEVPNSKGEKGDVRGDDDEIRGDGNSDSNSNSSNNNGNNNKGVGNNKGDIEVDKTDNKDSGYILLKLCQLHSLQPNFYSCANRSAIA
jgi:hypothetical protein